MPRLPRLSGKQLARLLGKLGYSIDRVRGSHHIYSHPTKETVVVPIHGNRSISIGTLHGIVKNQLEMTIEEFIEMVHG